MSLRYRIAVTIFVLEALMLAAVLTNTLGFSRDATHREILRSEETTLGLLAETSRRAFLTAEFAELQPFVEELAGHARVVDVRIADDRGRIVATTDPTELGEPLPAPSTAAKADGWRSATVSNVAGLLGTVQIRFSGEAFQASYEAARNRGLVLAAGGMALIALVGIVTGFLLTRRLGGVVEASRSFAAGDHAARAGTPGHDEIAGMGSAFDAMAEQIQDQMAALRLNERRQRELLEQMGDLIQSMDTDGRLLLVNRAWRRTLGWGEAEEELPDLGVLLGDEARAAVLLREVAEADGAVLRQLELRDRQGGTVAVDASLTAIREEEGIVSILAVMRDVTERVRLTRELQDKEQQLRHSQRMEGLGRLAGGVAHDFNNIMTVVLMEADGLIAGLDDADPLRASAVEIERSAQRAADLTRQLLAFGRRDVVKPEVMELDAALGELEPMLRRLIGEDVELRVEPGAEGARIEMDEGHLQQVVVNLVVNARDAMPEGGTLHVETSRLLRRGTAAPTGKAEEHWLVRLAVRDTGIGMDAETRQRVFDPFFTTKERGKGTGLGLATVYGIVTQAGGSVEIQSTPGEGSTLLVHLPEAEAPLSRAAPSQHRPPRERAGGQRILLVEDDDALRAVTRRVLASAGYDVTEMASPEDALERVEGAGPGFDLVLTDVVMPRVSGVEVARRVRSVCPETRVLLMSGYADVGTTLIEEELLTKPFEPSALLSTIARLLETDGDDGQGA